MQKHFESLLVWQRSMSLVKSIYKVSGQFPSSEVYGLTSQIRRAAVSIPANIAEGKGRSHKKESVRFFFIARGSVFELITLLKIAQDLDYLKSEAIELLLKDCSEIIAMLNGLIDSHK